jgi:gliding motility-associated-like protein
MRILVVLLLINSCAFAQTIKRAEYYFDSDPGKGNGTSISVTQGVTIDETHSISVASLGNGTHTLGLRVLDSNGTWSQSTTRTFFIVTPAVTVAASSIKKAEYFFDTDPGTGSAKPISISASSNENNSFVIDISSLSSGFHQLCVRYQDDLGRWSLFANRTFYLVAVPTAANATIIKKAEYFFDADPGRGNGTSLSISATASENNLFAINISSLTPGFHQLAIRYQDDKGHWSMFANRTFYIVPPANTTLSGSIKKAEYFFDADSGAEHGTPLAISSSSSQDNLFVINISSLTSGFHQLAIRYQDDKGHWSMFSNRTFYIVPPANTSLASAIKKAEYFFDTDPGAGHALPISLTSSAVQDNLLALDVSALNKGFHQLMIRYQDNKGSWSNFAQRTFYILPGTINTTNLQRIEYFIDTDPGINQGTSLSFTAAPSVNQVFTIDLGTTPPGNHMLYVRTKDSNGYWSDPVVSASFSVASCTVPTAPAGVNGSRCDVGSVTLSASGASGNQQYRWYVDGTTNTISFTGPSYSTNSLAGNTDFYASIYDPATGCESSRTKVSAAVTIVPKPVLNPAGSVTICDGSNLAIAAPIGYASYSWSNSAVTSGIVASTSANYSVTVSDGTCSSAPSDPLVLSVVPRPAKPIIQTTGNTTICGSGSVSLNAPAGATAYLWSTGETTQQISASATGNYSVQITDANNCQSVFSDLLPVQVLSTPNQPIISVIGSTSLCNGSSVVLAAPAGFTSYQWSTGANTQQVVISAAGNYSVVVGNGTCLSTASNAVAVTAAAPPAKPVVQVLGSTTICGSGSVVLTAPAGASAYLWSDGTTTQQNVVSNAGNYSVQVADANNCESQASDQVVVQVVATPAKPVVTALSTTKLCNNSSVILSAPSGFSNYLWSDGETTQQIVVTGGGNYSVLIGNAANCMSPAADQVTVTVVAPPAKPAVQVLGSTTICGSGSIVLTAPAGFTAYLWSDGTTTQQNVVSSAGNYSVQVVDANNCESQASDQVVVQVVATPAKPVVTATGKTDLCNNSSVILAAPSGFNNYVWSDGETTQQIVVTAAGNYSVLTGNAANCMSAAADQVTVTLTNKDCGGVPPIITQPNYVPPSIADVTFSIPVGNSVSFNLKRLVTAGSYNVEFSTLKIVLKPVSGPAVKIDSDDNLDIDYSGSSFVGRDSIGIVVCDSLGACTSRNFKIEVTASVEVFNAVSPFPDGLNDFFNLKYIDKIEDTKKNKVTIVDRWGNEVFSISDYNNVDRVFTGNDNGGKELPSGTYYYRIDFDSGRETLSGFLSLKR